MNGHGFFKDVPGAEAAYEAFEKEWSAAEAEPTFNELNQKYKELGEDAVSAAVGGVEGSNTSHPPPSDLYS